MSKTSKLFLLEIFFISVFVFFISAKTSAQNCTVNAGFDGGACFSNQGPTSNVQPFQLNGNSAGNLAANSNLLWELVSAPSGAVVNIATPNNNVSIVNSNIAQLPSGTYLFRLGINCLSGERIFDTVSYNVVNLSNFILRADKAWSSICSNMDDSIHLLARPLKTGEIFSLTGRSIQIISSNCNAILNTDIVGPTADSIRITVMKTDANYCSLNLFSYISYNLKNGYCAIYPRQPNLSFTVPFGSMGVSKVYASKTGPRTYTDTIQCINSPSFVTYANNICLKGGKGDFTDLNNNFSSRVLQGSGTVSVTNFGNPYVTNVINNKWDTVTRNSLHIYEITYGSNGCFPSFKDTIKVYFKSAAINAASLTVGSSLSFCYNASDFPLSNLKVPLAINGTMQPSWKLSNALTGPAGFSATLANPLSIDSAIISGTNIIPGYYFVTTNVIDTLTGCSSNIGSTQILLEKRATLPALRDTSICLANNSFVMPYPRGSLSISKYQFTILSGPAIQNLNQQIYINSDSTIYFGTNSYVSPPGLYTIRAHPISVENCNDGRSDTFQVSIISSGRFSNAGTDQRLLCNVTSTNLAGSLPSLSQGMAGFWKFLPAISTNAGAPIVIADSANRNTAISGFTNFSSYYFSWNVTDGNTGNYCMLLPDTVLIVFSGAAPSNAQRAQNDYLGMLNSAGTYLLTSNAQTPTFNVQWNKISGYGGNIVNPNSQNTLLTGLIASNYKYELVVTNTCGVFKDTVNLFFEASGLPLKLISFNGTKNKENEDYLTWNVEEEYDMKNYEVEVSENGFEFKTIGTVPISTSTNNHKTYSYINTKFFYANNFYRLKMINLDGSFTYSNIIKLANKSKSINDLKLYPSPATMFLTINIDSKEAQQTFMEIVNALGQSVFKKKVQLLKGANSILLDVSLFTKGLYYFKVNEMVEKLILE
jgi:Secretion system C-terminal sorting domain